MKNCTSMRCQILQDKYINMSVFDNYYVRVSVYSTAKHVNPDFKILWHDSDVILVLPGFHFLLAMVSLYALTHK